MSTMSWRFKLVFFCKFDKKIFSGLVPMMHEPFVYAEMQLAANRTIIAKPHHFKIVPSSET